MLEIERIEQVREHLKINKKKFSEILGFANSQSYTNLLSKTKVPLSLIRALKKYEPRLSLDWIFYGDGRMFLNSSSTSLVNEALGVYKTSDKERTKETQIAHLKKRIEDLECLKRSLEKNLLDKDKIIALLEKK